MKDTTIYDSTTLQDLLRDVDGLTKERRNKIKDMIDGLREFIKGPEDAVVFAPIVKEYLDVWIKNDDQLLKMGTIVQRIISAESYQGTSGDLSDILTEREKEQLRQAAANELREESKSVNDTLTTLDKKVAEVTEPTEK